MTKEPWERPTAEQLEDVATKFLQTSHWPVFGNAAQKANPESQVAHEQPHTGRKTEPIPQPRPELQNRPLSEGEGEAESQPIKKRTLVPWIIAVAVVIIGIVAVIVWPKGPSSERLTEQRRLDSIRVIDSLMMVEAQTLPPPPLPLPSDEISAEKGKNESGAKGEIFTVVEEQPSYPGGDEARISYLQQNVKYPEEARELGIQGKVFVTFIVEVNGSVTDVRVLRGIGGGCDEEAIRVIKGMPKWNPGKQKGVKVRVQFYLPLKFTLSN